MAGIQNQPGTKPSALPKTPSVAPVVPEAPDMDMFAPPTADETSMFAPPTQADIGMGGEFNDMTPTPVDQFESPWFTEHLPTVGAIGGGILGGIGGTVAGFGVGGVPGGIGGAAVGGALGQSLRDIIEVQLLGREAKPALEVAGDIGKSAALEGAGQAIGAGIAKVGGKVLAPIAKKALPYYDNVINGFKESYKVAADKIEQPVLKMLIQKGTNLTPQQSGDAVKTLLVDNIKGKYAPFIKAYGELDEVGKILPIADESRRGLTQKIREWSASELVGDDARVVKQFVDNLDAADNGTKLRGVISQIGDAKNQAFMRGASGQGQVLKGLQARVNDFMENETLSLAKRVAAGKATPQEMAGFERLMQMQQNPNVPVDPANLAKYTKSVASDYIKSVDKIKSDYRGFRSFLEDVAEQTKSKVGKRGPMSFADDLNDVPSEKLIERMFDPKNAAALKTMQKETPEVYQEVMKARMSALVQKSSPTGELDLKALHKEALKLPKDVRSLLFSPEDLNALGKAAHNPKLAALKKSQQKMEERLKGHLNDVAEAAIEKTPSKLKRGAGAALNYGLGSAAMPTVKGTGELLLRPQEELPRTVNGLGE